MSPRRVLLVQPGIAPPGGGSLVAAWMLQALCDVHRVTLFAWEAPDLGRVNRHFGTTLAAGDFALRTPPPSRLVAHGPTPLTLVRHLLLMRAARAVACEYDVVLTANNESDLGRPALQYVHYPMLSPRRPAIDLRWYSAAPGAVRVYQWTVRRLTGFSLARMRANTTLANSAYIAAHLRAAHGIAARVRHPPAPGDYPAVPWEARAPSVVAVGRFAPDKRLDVAVDVVAALRATHPAVTLHLVGVEDDAATTAALRRRAEASGGWLVLHEDLPRTALGALLARHRFGIHAMAGEHFGIAVAEMVRAGCVPFVATPGGPAEIVGGEAALCWGSPAEAVAKMRAVLDDDATAAALRERLAARADGFTPERFVADVRKLVAERVA